jgi:hypothetical protein
MRQSIARGFSTKPLVEYARRWSVANGRFLLSDQTGERQVLNRLLPERINTPHPDCQNWLPIHDHIEKRRGLLEGPRPLEIAPTGESMSAQFHKAC